eukprot:7741194-Prorocentrum_lima.AAC.1
MVLQAFRDARRQWHLRTTSRGRRNFIVPRPRSCTLPTSSPDVMPCRRRVGKRTRPLTTPRR